MNNERNLNEWKGIIMSSKKYYVFFLGITFITLFFMLTFLYSQTAPEKLFLKDYRPKSIYKIPKTFIEKAKYPIIDLHSHPYPETPEQIAQWVRNMNELGIEKTIILSHEVGAKFDSIYADYAKYADRFEVWCGFDYSGYDQSGFGPAAVAELERCVKVGARGVGELGDKGRGLVYCPTKAYGMHPDDHRIHPVIHHQ